MTQPASSLDLDDDAVTGILLRLPSDSVLRCRAVCRSWRAITTSPGFAAAYARCRRPLELIVQRHGANGVLDTIPLADLDEGRRRCLWPGYPSSPRGAYSLMGSCDGLLLFERDNLCGNDLWVCDPVTRHWTAAPPPHGARRLLTRFCGFYLHRPSGEHRLLLLANDDDRGGMGTSAAHYVLSLESGETRRLGPAAATVHLLSQFMADYLDHGGKLHWLLHPEVMDTDKILAFDTVSEAFRRIPRPPLPARCYPEPSLLEMDGRLAMSAIPCGSTHMELWVLEDYSDGESWRRRHRIDLPPTLLSARWAMNASAAGRSDVILLVDDSSGTLGLYDLTQGRVLKLVKLVTDATSDRQVWRCTNLSPHVFKDSLEQHAFFDIQKLRNHGSHLMSALDANPSFPSLSASPNCKICTPVAKYPT